MLKLLIGIIPIIYVGNDRYSFLFKLDPRDYRGWAYGLKKAGYATNPVILIFL